MSQPRGWRSAQTLCWQVRLLGIIAIVMFYLPISLGQKPVIFQYSSAAGVADYDEPEKLTVTNAIFETFSDENFALNQFTSDPSQGLALISNMNMSGSCFYRDPIQIPTCVENTFTSFGTMFFLKMSHPGSDGNSSARLQGLNFTITSDISKPVDAVLAVEIVWVGSNLTITLTVDKSNFTTTIPISSAPYDQPLMSFVMWLQYNSSNHVLDVYISDVSDQWDFLEGFRKSEKPVASPIIDLTNAFSSTSMYVGFSGSISNYNYTNNPASESSGYKIEAWTFNSNGLAPDYPRNADGTVEKSIGHGAWTLAFTMTILGITIPAVILIVCVLVFTIVLLYRRNARLTELAKKHDIDLPDAGPIKFKYKTLSDATKGFSEKELLGKGGFGSVYRGTLALKANEKPTEVAVKKSSASSEYGPSQFQAEVKIIGQLQHRHVVRLLGWCHDRRELLLVYEYMPNGSVDQLLYTNTTEEPLLTWTRRLTIMSGVAKAVAFLHDEWNKQVIHRDLKTSNVMLDSDFEARLGDFGLARLYEHGEEPLCTHFAGTHGYVAPELGVTCKPTEKTDVYSFGAMVLELATGKHPLLAKDDRESLGEVLLVDWVWGLHRNGTLLDAADSRLHNTYDRREMTKFLKIGLLCFHTKPDERPNMRDVISIWIGKSPLPQVPRSKPLASFQIHMDHSSELPADRHDVDNLPLCPQPDRSTDLSQTYHTALSFSSNDVNRDSLALEIGEEQPADTQDSTLRYRGTTTHLPF